MKWFLLRSSCLLGAALFYCSYPSVIINNDLFHSRKYPNLDDKFYGGPSYFDSQGKSSPEFKLEQGVF